MHTETENLKLIAEQIAANFDHTKVSPDKLLTSEAARLQKHITSHLLHLDNFTQRESFYFNTLNKLVEICDILYDAGGCVTPNVMILIDMLKELKKVIPSEVSPYLQLPKAFIVLNRGTITKNCEHYLNILKSQGIDAKLIKIAAIPFQQFIGFEQKLYWRNYTWLKGYQEKMDNVDWENADCSSKTEAFISLLLSCDFNHDRFFIYCKKNIRQRAGGYRTKRKRLAEFAECEKLILQDALDDFPAYNYRRPHITKKLTEWIRIEINTLRANENFDEDLYKVEYNWDVDTIALYHKYLMDHGITKKVDTKLYSKQIAATISSVTKEEFSWETIHKRLYSKEQRYLKKIFEPLASIVEQIKVFIRV